MGRLKQFGSQAGHGTSLAGCQRNVAEAALAGKGVNEHGEGVVRLAHVGSVYLTGVSREYHFGALTNTGEDGLQRGGLQVLCFVDYNELLL